MQKKKEKSGSDDLRAFLKSSDIFKFKGVLSGPST